MKTKYYDAAGRRVYEQYDTTRILVERALANPVIATKFKATLFRGQRINVAKTAEFHKVGKDHIYHYIRLEKLRDQHQQA